MNSVFVAIFLVFNTQTGQLEEAGVAAFDSAIACETMVARAKAKSMEDFQIHLEASCVEAPLFSAE